MSAWVDMMCLCLCSGFLGGALAKDETYLAIAMVVGMSWFFAKVLARLKAR